MRNGLGGIDTVALIGGTSDIGLAIARQLTTLGADRFILAGRDREAIETAASDLPIEEVVAVDVADVADHAKRIEAVFGERDIDVVILAAGVLDNDPTPEEIVEMAQVNGSGSVSLLAQIGARLKSQGHGHLIVISSMAVVRARPSNYWYGASKVPVDFAARGLADELEGTGISVTIVRPGFVHSRMTDGMDPAPFACEPEDIGRAAAGAVKQQTHGVLWVPGVLRWVALVLRWLPRSLLARLDR